MSYSYESDIELLNLIKGYPYLYDKSKGNSRKQEQRLETWKTIAKALQVSVKEVQTRYRHLRDRYVKVKTKVDQGGSGEPPWRMFPYLTFLDEHIKKRRGGWTGVKPCKADEDNVVKLRIEEYNSEDNLFVSLVQQLPLLYDSSQPDYKNPARRANAWKIIAEKMHMSVIEAQRFYRQLRDRYVKEKSKARRSGSESTWHLFPYLTFLDGHIQKRRVKPLKANQDNVVRLRIIEGKSEDSLLVSLVQQLPLLYNSSLPDYKNAAKRENAWKMIAEKMHMSVEDVQRRFKMIRDKYKEKEKMSPSVLQSQSDLFTKPRDKNNDDDKSGIVGDEEIITPDVVPLGNVYIPDQQLVKTELITSASVAEDTIDSYTEDTIIYSVAPESLEVYEPTSPPSESINSDPVEITEVLPSSHASAVYELVETEAVSHSQSNESTPTEAVDFTENTPSPSKNTQIVYNIVACQTLAKKNTKVHKNVENNALTIQRKKKSVVRSARGEDTEDSLFCRSLIPMFRRINNRKRKARIKSQFLSILADCESDD